MHFTEFLVGIHRDGNEQLVGGIIVTMNQDYGPETGTLDDVINAINGRNVIRDGLRVHIVDGHHCHGVFGELL